MNNEIKRVNCIADGCGTFAMDKALYDRYQKTGETFHCPAGHAQYFSESTESKLNNRIEELERKVRSRDRRIQNLLDSIDRYRSDLNTEKQRGKQLREALADNGVTGVIPGDEEWTWVCGCGGHGYKWFDEREDAEEALMAHREDTDRCSATDVIEQ